MCYVVCREIEINAVVVAPTSQHFLEIDDRCTYPGCTVCLMYCPAEGSIVETATGRSMVPPPPEVWTENKRWPRVPLTENDLNVLNVLNDWNPWNNSNVYNGA